jgi:hypothetical protein
MNSDKHNLRLALAGFLVAGLAGFAFSGGLKVIDRLDAERDYLERLRGGIRLDARNCSGSTEVGGIRPPGKEVVSCVDVAFTAYCPGSIVGAKGVLRNFTGPDVGCVGDKASIGKPACKAEELRVVVDEVRPCGK